MKRTTSTFVLIPLLALFLLVSLNSLNWNVGSAERRLQDTGEIEDYNPVIVILITEDTRLHDLCLSIKTLVNAKGDLDAQILAFHVESTPTLEQQNALVLCSQRQISFALMPLGESATFPDGFIPTDGVDYTSAHINRFWSSGIWNHKLLKNFNIIMKIDDSSCFSIENDHLPNFKNPIAHKYKAHIFPGTVEQNSVPVQGMHQFALDYMKSNSMIPNHSELWQRIHYTFHEVRNLAKFEDSFEVVNKNFMMNADVSAWLTALTDGEPYGYYNNAWNVESERILTMAMFGSKTTVDTTTVPGFVEKDNARNRPHDKICTEPFANPEQAE